MNYYSSTDKDEYTKSLVLGFCWIPTSIRKLESYMILGFYCKDWKISGFKINAESTYNVKMLIPEKLQVVNDVEWST